MRREYSTQNINDITAEVTETEGSVSKQASAVSILGILVRSFLDSNAARQLQ